MRPIHHSLVGFIVTILLIVRNISSVPSGKLELNNKTRVANINGGISLEQDRFDCIALLPSDCSGVLLSARWLLTLSYCVNNTLETEVEFRCKGKSALHVDALQRISTGHFSLLFLKREPLLSRMFYFELPQNADDKQLEQTGFVSIIPKQTKELRAEPVFVDKCPFKDERIRYENICFTSKTKSSLDACELNTGQPVATLINSNKQTVVALLDRNECHDTLHRQRRSINQDRIIGKRITQSDVKWIRKVRSIEGKRLCDPFFLDLFACYCSSGKLVPQCRMRLRTLDLFLHPRSPT